MKLTSTQIFWLTLSAILIDTILKLNESPTVLPQNPKSDTAK